MKICKGFFFLVISAGFIPCATFAQNDFCTSFAKVKQLMDEKFNSVKGTKTTETTTNYGSMIITKKIWGSKFLFPEALSADITEILRVAPDPNNAGHNIYISFSLAKNSTRAIAEAAFTKAKANIKLCSPANWRVEEHSGNTYSKIALMNGTNYDSSPLKVTLQFNKLEGPGDKYTADLIFDSAVK